MVHHNRPDLTDMAVYSLRAHTPRPYRLLLIDNASGDDLACLQPDELWINSRPRSFAQNCNLGLQRGQGQPVVLLNNDVFLPPGWLEGLLRGLDTGHAVVSGISNFEVPLNLRLEGVRIKLGAQGDRQDIGGRWTALSEVLGDFNNSGRQRLAKLKNWVSFYAVALAPQVIERLALLDESFVHGYEDMDYCLRAWRAGFTVATALDAYLIHFGGRSTPGAGPRQLAARDRHNLAWLLKRHGQEERQELQEIWNAHGLAGEGRELWARLERRWSQISEIPERALPADPAWPALSAAPARG